MSDFRKRRLLIGKTTQQVADDAGLSRQAIQKLETKRFRASVSTMQAYATALRVPYKWVVVRMYPGITN